MRAILDPEAPAAVIVPNDFADSVTVVTVKPEGQESLLPGKACGPASPRPAKGGQKDDTAPVVEGELPLRSPPSPSTRRSAPPSLDPEPPSRVSMTASRS